MNDKDKQVALIEAYIEVCQKEGYEDYQIIEALVDIFDQNELEELGFEEFIKEYYVPTEACKWKCHNCNKTWYVDVNEVGVDWCPFCGVEVSFHSDKTNRFYTLEME